MAHRFEVDRSAYSAKLKKTPIPRPPIPAGKTTESTNPVAPSTHTTGEPVPVPAPASALQTTPTGSADATDVLTPTVSSTSFPQAEEVKEPETERKDGDAEPTKAVPVSYGKADENDGPVRKSPLEDESEQSLKNVDAERTVAAPLRDEKVSDEGPLRKRPLEDEPKNEQNGVVNAESTKTALLRHGKAGENDVLARKRPFEEEEPKKEAEEQEDDKTKPRKRVPLRHSKAGPSSREPAQLTSSEVGSEASKEQNNARLSRTKAISSKYGQFDCIEPARKRQRTTDASISPALKQFPPTSNGGRSPLSVGSERSDSDNSSELTGESTSSNTSTESDENDPMRVPLLGDDAADPTPFELNPEACAFLRTEAARGLARFTTAKMRVVPMERQLDLENHDLEKSRSELLRIMLMLPREDRTTLWTNMGQPDARTLLGLLPETPGPSRSTRSLIKIQTRLARIEAAEANGTNESIRDSDPGFLALQKTQAKTGSKQKLHEQLEIERKMERLAMPPPMPPPLPVRIFKTSPPEKVATPRSSPASNTPSRASSSRGKASQEGSTSQTSPSRRRSTSAAQSTITSHVYSEDLIQALADAHKANPDSPFSANIPKEIQALKAQSTRKYTVSEGRLSAPGPSNTPPDKAPVRTPAAFYNQEPMEDMKLALIKATSEAKRKHEAMDAESDDDQYVPIGVEPPGAKRRRTKASDL